MSRSFDGTAKTRRASDFSRCYLVRLDVPNWTAAPFTDGVLRFNTTPLDFDINTADDSASSTYYGADGVLNVSRIQEQTELKRNGIEVQFSGLNNELLNLFLTSSYDINRTKCFIYDCVFEVSGSTEFANPNTVRVHKGLVDSVKYSTSSEATTIRIKTVSQLSDWSRPRIRKLNEDSQKEKDSSDASMEFLAKGVGTIQQVTWGSGD